jgi:hypothetical protein
VKLAESPPVLPFICPVRGLPPLPHEASVVALSALFHTASNFFHPLSPFVSAARFHSFALFFTLKPVSPVFAAHTKSTPGYTPSRVFQNKRPSVTGLESIPTDFRGRKSFIPHTYGKNTGRGWLASPTVAGPATHYSPLTTRPQHPPSHCVPSRTGSRFTMVGVQTTETSPLSMVSKHQSGPKPPKPLVTDYWSLISRFRARKAPRV